MTAIIGITPSLLKDAGGSGVNERWAVSQSYVNAVVAAGGAPIILPPHDGKRDELLGILDGLLFSGGADFDPALYGDSDLHPLTYDINPQRDRFEIELIREGIARDLPMLGICRGIQALNVALAGTLFQHLPDQVPGALPHRQQEIGVEAAEPSHRVKVDRDSDLARIYGADDFAVNSFHHQAIREPSALLDVLGVADDGVIEAVALRGRAWVLGLQWHPEMMFERHPEHLRPFTGLIEASTARKLAAV